MPKVSVIVPVYNAEQYLTACVRSILAQTVKDLELILVDDGSTDTSPALCDAFAAEDPRVRVIHKPNGRAGSARNAGLKAALGEYVAFVDADDWISPNMYETMLEAGAEVCLCDYVRFKGPWEQPFSQPNVNGGFYSKDRMRRHIYPHLVMDGVELPIAISNCVLLIRRSVLTENGLAYREDIHICEDAPFGSMVLYCAGSFAYLKGQYLYHYRVTEGSASRSYRSWWWDSFLRINEETENYFGNCPDYDFSQQIKANMFYFARVVLHHVLADGQLSRKEQNRSVRAVMDHPRVVRMMAGYDTTGLPLSLKAEYWSIRYRSVPGRRFVGFLSRLRTKLKNASKVSKERGG